MKSSARAPQVLSKEAKSLWNRLLEDYEITDSAGLLLLATALEAFDRMREAQELLKKDGIVTFDRFKQSRAHPASLVERDARNSMLKALRALNLDLIPPGIPGRPPAR